MRLLAILALLTILAGCVTVAPSTDIAENLETIDTAPIGRGLEVVGESLGKALTIVGTDFSVRADSRMKEFLIPIWVAISVIGAGIVLVCLVVYWGIRRSVKAFEGAADMFLRDKESEIRLQKARLKAILDAKNKKRETV